jgi:pyruvate dehydrogenase E1 component alpha subunit
MNLAAVQKAPLVVVVENNQWAYSTPVSRQVPLRDLSGRARAYGIPGMVVDGNDIVAVMSGVSEAVERARRGDGPVLVEAKTMRMVGHAQHDAATYVPREMLDYWKGRDPIHMYETYLTRNQLWGDNTKQEVDARVQRDLTEDLALAEGAPFPPPESAVRDVMRSSQSGSGL